MESRRPPEISGFSVVEVVIAIVILSIGILGLAGTAASVTRMVGRGQIYNKAASMAAERFEILRATPCGGMAGGAATQGRYTITWTVADVTNGKQVGITVTSPTTRGSRTDAFNSIISCVTP